MRTPRQRDDSGATAVEFAIVGLVAFPLIFLAIYAGLYYFYAGLATHVARVVAHDASIPDHGQYPGLNDELTVAHNAAGKLLPDPTSVTLVPDPSPGEGNELTVTVTYDVPGISAVEGLLPFLSSSHSHITRTVTVRYE